MANVELEKEKREKNIKAEEFAKTQRTKKSLEGLKFNVEQSKYERILELLRVDENA